MKPVPRKEPFGALGDHAARIAGLAEYRRRLELMVQRQDFKCAFGGLPFWSGNGPTFDHSEGRTSGHRDDRTEVDGRWQNAAAHWICNGNAGSRRYEWTQDNSRYVPKEK